MDSSANNQFMKEQIEEIMKHKWIESEKSGYDLGDVAVKDWISKYAAIFRQNWNNNHKQ